MPQEYFTDLTAGEEKIVDLLVEVRQAGEEAAFLVHVEAQSYTEADFPRRMFFYFARLYQKYLQHIYSLRLQLEQKVGTLPEQVRDRLSQLDKERLERLAIALLNFTSLRELEAWLAGNF